MVTMMMLMFALTAADSPERHVRATEPRLLTLIEAGLAHSNTFRRLIDTLNASDVIVYIEPKLTRQALRGYLAHHIVATGGRRYLHIAIQTQGSERHLISLLAHELQHAVEVSQYPDVHDARGLEQLFSRLALQFGCDSFTCFETQAARDVETIVGKEFVQKPSASLLK